VADFGSAARSGALPARFFQSSMAMFLQSLEFSVRPQPYAIVPDLKRDNAAPIMPGATGQSNSTIKEALPSAYETVQSQTEFRDWTEY
jgi:hypothetical protein